MKKQRSVTLNADTYAMIETAATACGESVSAYVAKAADARRRQQEADAYAAYCAQPQIAGQVSAYLRAVRPLPRTGADA